MIIGNGDFVVLIKHFRVYYTHHWMSLQHANINTNRSSSSSSSSSTTKTTYLTHYLLLHIIGRDSNADWGVSIATSDVIIRKIWRRLVSRLNAPKNGVVRSHSVDDIEIGGISTPQLVRCVTPPLITYSFLFFCTQ